MKSQDDHQDRATAEPKRTPRQQQKRQVQRYIGSVDELDLDAWEDEDELETFEPLPRRRKGYSR